MEKIENNLEAIISGGLKNTIDAHGPITKVWIGSASKRIKCLLNGSIIDSLRITAEGKLEDGYIMVNKKDYAKMVEKQKKQAKTIRRFVLKLKEAGIEI